MFKKITFLTGFVVTGLLLCEVVFSADFQVSSYVNTFGVYKQLQLNDGTNSATIKLDEEGNVEFDDGSGVSKTATFTRNEAEGVTSLTNETDNFIIGMTPEVFATMPEEQKTDVVLYLNSLAGYAQGWNPSSTIAAPYGFDGFFWILEKLAFKFGKERSGGADADDFGTYSFSCCHMTTASGNSSTAFGYINVASGDFSAVLGGSSLLASGAHSAVIGGSDNTNAGTSGSVIIGGSTNETTLAADAGIMAAGTNNINHSGFSNILLGGDLNTTQSNQFATIINGASNITVGGGNYNTIINGNHISSSGDNITVIGNYTRVPVTIDDENVIALLGGTVTINKKDIDIPSTDTDVFLDVYGDIRHREGDIVTGSPDKLRILAGIVTSTGTISGSWSGYTARQIGTGHYGIVFTTPFSGSPACTVTPNVNKTIMARIASSSATNMTIVMEDPSTTLTDSGFHFQCVGNVTSPGYTVINF